MNVGTFRGQPHHALAGRLKLVAEYTELKHYFLALYEPQISTLLAAISQLSVPPPVPLALF